MDPEINPQTPADELVSAIRELMIAKRAEPEDVMTALGQLLTSLSLTLCEYHGNTHAIHEIITRYFNEMHRVINEHINEHKAPEEANSQYMSLEQIQELTKDMAERTTDNDADRQARINACKLIMDNDNYGFLLLGCMKNNNVKLSTNLQDESTRDNMLGVLRETLYGNGQHSFRIKPDNSDK